ncbi:MAG: fumarylacetoacetate hydrolase family protein [Bacteroidetes bacterium]|nr:fumarylacetoacetate hydrolase family protein [Bacteroidota bacterium]
MKIFCIGRNYAAHAKELGNDVPEEPVIFLKPKSALLPTGTLFHYPEFTNELHYECELVLRVSKNGRYISARQAATYYDAITVGIDFTARDIQQDLKTKGLPWEKAKAWDHSAVLGSWLPIESFADKPSILFSLQKDGQIVQQGDSSLMIYSFNRIVSEISNYFSLQIGDLIYTGTPAGVGEVVPGDMLEGFIGSDSLFKLEVK